jgi:hypothetical protein
MDQANGIKEEGESILEYREERRVLIGVYPTGKRGMVIQSRRAGGHLRGNLIGR